MSHGHTNNYSKRKIKNDHGASRRGEKKEVACITWVQNCYSKRKKMTTLRIEGERKKGNCLCHMGTKIVLAKEKRSKNNGSKRRLTKRI